MTREPPKVPEAHSEQTSARVREIASRGLRDPASLSHEEIKAVCASALTQAPDRP